MQEREREREFKRMRDRVFEMQTKRNSSRDRERFLKRREMGKRKRDS
jgi:hypothetical protein